MNDLLWLDQPGCDDPVRVGGKAANLARLAARCPVPPGFVLTAAAHARSPGDSLPDDLARAVADAYAALGTRCGAADPAVAVRSSAVDEDGASASFAGIFASYLNVRGLDAVLAAIVRCWSSAADPRVLAYRRERGGDSVGLGVLVQALVAADAAAVVFSVNPTSRAADELVINANWGLGESIVGGLATPDTWILRRPALSTIQFRLGDKAQMTVRSDGGTREVPVLRTLRARACLTDAQVHELGALALRLEDAMGWPVDLECAYEAGRLYLLQCRPITALR
ncbi:PEP/pyruvate-binding domain-containing protein [Nannocystis punicea]|uniref:Phosphoenolpyruvate synthase n=1 Tax=Nannocystis punicea TaxID=2995304 RepID=A0ABY7HBG4_9BACT|nr:PEP/pyruvate-binding domain-containing protein [Nannocystis poenicansa]WAS96614.1 PEP/pyruvate-binding domain-containing protein [Nannocystis poenicansa]